MCNDAAPSPCRSSLRPRVRSLIAVSLRSATGRCGLIRPPGRKLQPLSYPPPAKKIDQNPLTKRRCHAIPRPFQPPPTHTLIDCGVVEVGDQAVQSNSPARSQIATSILPSPPKILTKIHSHKEDATPPPCRSSLRLCVCSLITVLLRLATGGEWAVRSNSPAQWQITTSILSPPAENSTKIPSQNKDATPSPSRSSPLPHVRSLIAVFLRSVTGWCGLIHPPGRKLRPLSYPPR